MKDFWLLMELLQFSRLNVCNSVIILKYNRRKICPFLPLNHNVLCIEISITPILYDYASFLSKLDLFEKICWIIKPTQSVSRLLTNQYPPCEPIICHFSVATLVSQMCHQLPVPLISLLHSHVQWSHLCLLSPHHNQMPSGNNPAIVLIPWHVMQWSQTVWLLNTDRSDFCNELFGGELHLNPASVSHLVWPSATAANESKTGYNISMHKVLIILSHLSYDLFFVV